jgi:hypothetical protein
LTAWRDTVAGFQLAPSTLFDLKCALLARLEKKDDAASALALLAAEPTLLASPKGTTFSHLRELARKSGKYEEAAGILDPFAARRIPLAASERAALEADRLEAAGDKTGASHALARAAYMEPAVWEYSRRLAELHLQWNQPAEARAVLGRFLTSSNITAETNHYEPLLRAVSPLVFVTPPEDREAAIAMWNKL